MNDKFHYVLMSINTIEGSNWGWYTDPGTIYFSSATAAIEDRSVDFTWTCHLAEATTFDSLEAAHDALEVLWGSIHLGIYVIVIPDYAMNEAIRDYPTQINMRTEKIARDMRTQDIYREVLRNFDSMSASLTKIESTLSV